MTLSSQTVTPLLPFFSFSEQCKAALVKEMVGKKLNELRTPTLVIDRKIVQRNCEKLGKASSDLGIKVRVHVKTHKTIEGAEIQLKGTQADAIVVSTMAEAHYMINSRLTESGVLKEVLLGFPISPDKFSDALDLSKKVSKFLVFIDNVVTLNALEEYLQQEYGNDIPTQKINVFLKVDCGYHRAGAPLNDLSTLELAKRLQDSDYVDFYGIYTHAGHSYSAKSAIDGLEYLKTECDMARRFRDYFTTNGVVVKTVSIGATPTIHAVVKFAQEDKENIKQVLDGINELHAGAFSFLDRQQAATGLCTLKDIAISVVSRVASNYSDRDSLLIDGGALAFSKDTAPQGGFGYVLDPAIKPDINQEPIVLATLTKVAQEHGVVSDLNSSILSRSDLGIGSLVRVLPNHCCLAAASHMYYLIVEDGSDVVLDVWVPVKGW